MTIQAKKFSVVTIQKKTRKAKNLRLISQKLGPQDTEFLEMPSTVEYKGQRRHQIGDIILVGVDEDMLIIDADFGYRYMIEQVNDDLYTAKLILH